MFVCVCLCVCACVWVFVCASTGASCECEAFCKVECVSCRVKSVAGYLICVTYQAVQVVIVQLAEDRAHLRVQLAVLTVNLAYPAQASGGEVQR